MKSKQRKRLNRLNYRRKQQREITSLVKYMLEGAEFYATYVPPSEVRSTQGIIPYIRSIQREEELRTP